MKTEKEREGERADILALLESLDSAMSEARRTSEFFRYINQ